MAPRPPVLATVLVALGLLAGCAATDPGVRAGSVATLAPDASVPPVEGIAWTTCGSGLQCGTLAVPLDHDHPGAASITLHLTRHLATDPAHRIGSLLVNPGGPGVAALWLASSAAQVYDPQLLRRFDIVAFDPRGVGTSEPHVDCVDDLDPFFAVDPTPDDAAEHQALLDASRDFAARCAAKSGTDLLAHVSTREVAMDMDLIRQALREDKISYFGFSYGSELGATWATLFPSTVRAAVLDSAPAPNADDTAQLIDDTVSLEKSFDTFLADCGDDPGCAFHGDGNPAEAFTQLMDRLDRSPLPSPAGRPAVNEAIAGLAVISSLYDASHRPALARALAAAQQGDGSLLLALYDAYLFRNPDGTFSNEFETLLAVDCLEHPGPTTVQGVDDLVTAETAAAPFIGRIESLPYACAEWPVPAVPRVKITGEGAGPILVIGATGDPITSIESSRKMAQSLQGGVLVTVKADKHIAYGVNACGNRAVDDYLVSLTVPADGTVCD